ncbi:MAG TPA: T4 RnlA family RNA ligase [Ktedonobacterales bacterium]|nr:T4 RnlA family RNA ligase [Ktedonobacterales bacterium]
MNALYDLLAAVRRYGPDVEKYRTLGEIKATLHPNGELLIFNYTPKATYNRKWPQLERICRGLIVHWPTATVRALPFDKFFNLNEMPETQPEALPEGPIEATVKLDGSLAITYHDGTDWAVATRGSFAGPQAQWATAFLRARHALDKLPADLTLLFEMIYPANRVVVNYGDTEALILIGARWHDGRDASYAELTTLGQRFNLPVVETITVTGLDELVALAQSEIGVEGWVMRFTNGLRAKIKTIDYIQLSRFLVGLTSAKIRDLLLESPDRCQKYILALPDELQDEASALVDAITALVGNEVERLRNLMAGPLATAAQASRREFAEVARRDYPADAPFLFKLLDSHDIHNIVLRKLDLTALGLSSVMTQRQQRALEG